MKVPSPLFLAGTLTLTWGMAAPALATPEPDGLTFDLEPLAPANPQLPGPSGTPTVAEGQTDTPAPDAPPAIANGRMETLAPPDGAGAALPIPAEATTPPLATGVGTPAPTGLYGGDQSLAWGDNPWPGKVSQRLPAPPPRGTAPTVNPAADPAVDPPVAPGTAATPAPPGASTPTAQAPSRSEAIPPQSPAPRDTVAITLEVPPTALPPTPLSSAAPAPPAATFQGDLAPLFAGGVDSLVARAVGSAEGTRTPEGHRNPAYYGHVDPGNGAWNLGTFSYQHGAASPEEADTRQLQRLQRQTRALQAQATAKGLTLSQRELLNGIDLANQAPLAALGRGGYIDWLAQARSLSMPEAEGIVWARTRSFLDPDTQRWNAPGLGNTVHSITRDQARRATAIDRALAVPSSAPMVTPSDQPLAIAPDPSAAMAAAFPTPCTYGPGEPIP